MPFTFAHPAIVLPLQKASSKWFSGVALIVGSITPDFAYFFRMRVHSDCSHTLAGILWFNIPVAIALLFTYLFIVQKPLLRSIPRYISRRIPVIATDKTFLIRRTPVFLTSLLIGIASHLFWDAFTHEHGFFTERIAWLHSEHAIFGKSFYGYKINQHAGTLLGLLFMLIYFIRIPKTQPVKPPSYWRFFGIVVPVSLAVFVLRFVISPSAFSFGNCVVSAISAMFAGIIVASAIMTFAKKN